MPSLLRLYLPSVLCHQANYPTFLSSNIALLYTLCLSVMPYATIPHRHGCRVVSDIAVRAGCVVLSFEVEHEATNKSDQEGLAEVCRLIRADVDAWAEENGMLDDQAGAKENLLSVQVCEQARELASGRHCSVVLFWSIHKLYVRCDCVTSLESLE